jgi:hypothetical protein
LKFKNTKEKYELEIELNHYNISKSLLFLESRDISLSTISEKTPSKSNAYIKRICVGHENRDQADIT